MSAPNNPKPLSFDDYQAAAEQTAKYPHSKAFDYLAHGLAGEASEVLEQALTWFVATGELLPLIYASAIMIKAGRVAEMVKKMHRDDGGSMTIPRSQAIKSELGDVQWYNALLCTELGIPMSEVAQANIEKLRKRIKRGTLHGEGER